jgi:hypothetical protein
VYEEISDSEALKEYYFQLFGVMGINDSGTAIRLFILWCHAFDVNDFQTFIELVR